MPGSSGNTKGGSHPCSFPLPMVIRDSALRGRARPLPRQPSLQRKRPLQDDHDNRRTSKRRRREWLFGPPQLIQDAALRGRPLGIELKLLGFQDHHSMITEVGVQEIVEEALTLELAPGEAIANFKVRINVWRSPHAAWIILPDATKALPFLTDRAHFFWEGHRLEVTETGRPVDPFHAEQLLSQTYIPAAAKLVKQALENELRSRISLQQLSLGVWYRGFSTEYTVNQDDESRLFVLFNPNRGSFIVECERQESRRCDSLVAVVRDIEHAWADKQQHCIVFRMRFPVCFERRTPDRSREDGERHTRTTSFGTGHKSAACTSATFLIRFPGQHEYDVFVERANKIDHVGLVERPVSIRALNLYDDRHLAVLKRFYKSIPLPVALQCEQAIYSGDLRPLELISLKDEILKTLDPTDHDCKRALITLQNLVLHISKHRDLPVNLFSSFNSAHADAFLQTSLARAEHRDIDVALCRQIFVTPTAFIIEPAVPDQSNSVLRRYLNHQHHFIRVTFTDEGGQIHRLRRPFAASFSWEEFIRDHVGSRLKHGLDLGGREWQWLGYSNSALKEGQMIFMSPFDDANGNHIDADAVRRAIGVFTKVEKHPAKYGARIGQAFSATNSSIEINDQYIEKGEDIPDLPNQKYYFTDGAGEMSLEMAHEIWGAMRKKRRKPLNPPSAFQARFMGCKGVWMVNPTLPGKLIRYTETQKKFESSSRGFEVAATSQRKHLTYLNRPLVNLLGDLGVPQTRFMELQGEAVAQVERCGESFHHTAQLFRNAKLGTSFRAARLFEDLYTIHVDFNTSPLGHIDFFQSVKNLAITHQLRDIKFRARIKVDGPTLIGVCDRFGILKEGEIYVKTLDLKNRQPQRALEGRVLVTRSPVIHPGDVQLASAIGEVGPSSPLAHLVNVVVFSAQGTRPLPSMLGGGDLDGDIFNIITDSTLFPEVTEAPGMYTSAEPSLLDRPSDMHDIANFVVDYILYDNVGQIASKHLAISDSSLDGSFDVDCLRLAELSSHAVDFVKSGTPVRRSDFPPKAKSKDSLKPDFLAASHDDPASTYLSNKTLGKMFRAVPMQKYVRPEGDHQNVVDAHVLHTILRNVEHFHDRQFRFPNAERRNGHEAKNMWSNTFKAFCSDSEKVAYRCSISRYDDHKLGEEELFLGTSGTIGKVEGPESNLMHNARLQMSALTGSLRKFIKDMRDGDVEFLDDDGDWDESENGEGEDAIPTKKEEPPVHLSLTINLEGEDDKLGQIHSTIPNKSTEHLKCEELDPDVVEIDAAEWGTPPTLRDDCDSRLPLLRLKVEDAGIRHPPTQSVEVSDFGIEETSRPAWEVLAIRRAYLACNFALLVLEGRIATFSPPPFGTRLFTMCALETLLYLIRHAEKTALTP